VIGSKFKSKKSSLNKTDDMSLAALDARKTKDKKDKESTKVATGKMVRSTITGIAAAKIGAVLAIQKSKQVIYKDKLSKEQQLENEIKIGKLLFSALGQLRGTALKVSQLLSTEIDLLPEGVRAELAKSCYQVIPLNRALINKVFISEFSVSPSDIFSNFEPKAFAAASLGQVHKAETPSGFKVAVKIQYPGIAASINSDMKMLRALLSSIAKKSDILPNQEVINEALDEIQERLQEEVDYNLEAENTRWFRQKLLDKGVVVPSVHQEYSTEKVLTTSLLTGLHLDEWLATNPSQNQRNIYGQLIYDSFMFSAFELGSLHADPHPGNYLFMEKEQLGMLDFGCVKTFNKDFSTEKAALLNSFLTTDEKQRSLNIFSTYQEQGIIAPSLSITEFEAVLQPLLEPMYQWISAPFKDKVFDFSNYLSCPKMTFDNAKSANKYLLAIPQDQIYFDRSMFGIFSMLKRIGAVVKTENLWIFPNRFKGS
jgi:predicted unusual protein kinase regulating ubiquinone biosynthesis (AarF/ABC1/UbiB family)